uniref:Uncharacterized protein n=1 Tax=Kalanchoe fedtschenkoi TaxID=63787 RepID=A0A7N0SYK9_KALFE
MAASTKLAVTCLFILLACFVSATVVYTTVTDGLPFRKQLLTPWMAATLVDFYINVFAIAAWVFYKENCWIRNLVWLVLLVCLGSITTCVYVTWQLLKLSSQEAAQDPIYHVLLRNDHKGVKDRKATCFSVSVARIIFCILGCLMLGTLAYTILTDGSPFRKELLTPWLTATLVDFYTNVIAISVWVTYKESNWISAFIWILLLICTGSLGTCSYIVSQLFHLSPQDPVYLILINSTNRAESRYEEAPRL